MIVAGSTHYRGRGFTFDPETWDEYFAMLDAMLFLTPRKSETNNDQGNGSDGAPADVENGLGDSGADQDESFTEATGLLSPKLSPSMERHLRPSIFTTIAAHMDREQAKEEEDEEEQEAGDKSDKAGTDDEWTDL